MNEETYIGDGVYVSVPDNGPIKLRAPREHGDDVIYLDIQMFKKLCEFIRIKCNFDVRQE